MPTEKRQRQKEGSAARRQAAMEAARKQQRRRRFITLGVLVVGFLAVMLAISLLSDDKDDKKDVATTGDTTESTTGDVTTTTTTPVPTSAPPADPEPGGDAALTELGIEDIEVGDGAEVKAGDTIVAHYYGFTWKDGKKFQSSWDSGSTFETVIGQGAVIQGWDEGIPGMKVGGRRLLKIPAEQAYGAEDTGDGRPHGDLGFIIDVYAIK